MGLVMQSAPGQILSNLTIDRGFLIVSRMSRAASANLAIAAPELQIDVRRDRRIVLKQESEHRLMAGAGDQKQLFTVGNRRGGVDLDCPFVVVNGIERLCQETRVEVRGEAQQLRLLLRC